MAKQNMRNVKSNVGIIVTRPSGQSQNFINRIKKGGYTAFDLPGIMIVPTRYQKNAIEMLNRAAQYDYVLFTSPNSVRFAKRLKLNFQSIKGFISIGSGTEKALKPFIKNRESITAPKPYTSEALVQTLKDHGMTGKSVLIISGEGGRRLLDEAINNLGGTGEYCDVYRREIPESFDIAPILAFKSDKEGSKRSLYLTISSQEAFMNLLPTLESSGIKSLIDGVFVGSDRLKNIVETEGFNPIIVARSALENDLWQSIVNTLGNHQDQSSPSEISSNNDKERSMTKEQKQNETNNVENVAMSKDEVTNIDAKQPEIADNQDSAETHKPHAQTTRADKNASAKSRNKREKAPINKSNDAKAADSAVKTDTDTLINADVNSQKTDEKNSIDKNGQENNTENLNKTEQENPKGNAKEAAKPTKADKPMASADGNEAATKKPNQSLSYVAIILALGGFALGGLGYYQSMELQSKVANLSTTLQTEDSTTASLKNEIANLKSELATLKNDSKSTAADTGNDSLKNQVSLIAQKHDALNDTLSDSAKGLQQQIDALKAAQDKFSAQGQSIDNIAKVSNQAITIANDFDKKLAEQALTQSVVLDEAKQLISTIKNITDLEMLRTTEVDYLLKTAIQKVQYDKDYKTAASILNSALDRISQINSINFAETKNLINSNIDELNQLQPVNLADVTARLDKITSLTQQAPLKSDSALETIKNEVFNQAMPEGETWTDKLSNSLRHLIVIEDKRVEAPELMAKEDRFFLLQNIQLELTAAKVAILQDQYTVFKESLTTVQTWIKTYFDADNTDTREAIAQIQWLLDAKLNITPPNIERTLTDFEATLRAYKGVQQ